MTANSLSSVDDGFSPCLYVHHLGLLLLIVWVTSPCVYVRMWGVSLCVPACVCVCVRERERERERERGERKNERD